MKKAAKSKLAPKSRLVQIFCLHRWRSAPKVKPAHHSPVTKQRCDLCGKEREVVTSLAAKEE